MRVVTLVPASKLVDAVDHYHFAGLETRVDHGLIAFG